ncbi:ANK_REP_REGION domain-containing protein [Brevibacillus sp. IT-7CA2]|uniref:hypothetical protein n=1 Tax=Brevibacillus sp. IT-7CA2 TaxID=3026436 RepID=UPI0039E1A9DF
MELMAEMEIRFSQLLEGLNVGLIVLIENDFFFTHEIPERVVSDLACLNNQELCLLLATLEKLGFESLAHHIKETMDAFHRLPVNRDHLPSLYQIKRIVHYLDKIEHDETNNVKLKVQGLITLVKEEVDSHLELRDIFMRYGVGIGNVSSYSQLFRLAKDRAIRAYKKKPDVEEILQDINESLTPSQFCICIVDKLLEDDDGIDFIKKELFPNCVDKNLISIIYTSQPETKEPYMQVDLSELKDYYVVEVEKGNVDALKQLTNGLALCAFVELFNRLSMIQSKSIEKTLNLALSRKDNMIYLASMAHEEGITPYETISNWFQLATQYQIVNEMMGQDTKSSIYHFLLGLTHFLQEEFLGSEIGVELNEEAPIQKLNTFEIFDYTVNIQHQPPVAGDVYEMSDGKFAVLVGQDCDLMVRGAHINRNTRHADLLRAEFVATRNFEKVTKESKALEFNYFCKEAEVTDYYGVLKVKFESPFTSDFIILDLCTFNQNGLSTLDLIAELDPMVKKVLPSPWRNYHGKLKKLLSQYRQHRELCESVDTEMDILQTNDLAAIEFHLTDQKMSYPVRRVCRIKREFRDILLNSYWEYRRRAATNTIGLVEREKIPYLDIQIGYPGQKHTALDAIEVEAYIRKSNNRKNNRDYKKISLFVEIDPIKEDYSQLAEIQEKVIEIEKSSFTHKETGVVFRKVIIDDKIDSVMITIPYKLEHSNQFLPQEKFAVTDLLGQEQKTIAKQKASSLYFVFENAMNQHFPLYNVDKKKYVQLEVEHLIKGIIIPDLNIKIGLNNGIIKVNQIESVLVGS